MLGRWGTRYGLWFLEWPENFTGNLLYLEVCCIFWNFTATFWKCDPTMDQLGGLEFSTSFRLHLLASLLGEDSRKDGRGRSTPAQGSLPAGWNKVHCKHVFKVMSLKSEFFQEPRFHDSEFSRIRAALPELTSIFQIVRTLMLDFCFSKGHCPSSSRDLGWSLEKSKRSLLYTLDFPESTKLNPNLWPTEGEWSLLRGSYLCTHVLSGR